MENIYFGHLFCFWLSLLCCNYDRYKLSVRYENWPDIVDYANDLTTLETQIGNFANNIITSRDNLLIWFPRGHGSGNDNDPDLDDGSIYLFQDNPMTTVYFLETYHIIPPHLLIYNILKFKDLSGNNKYKRKKIILSTCRSGNFISGNKTFLNNGDSSKSDDNSTLIITSCQFNELGIRQEITHTPDDEHHSGLNYAIYCSLMGKGSLFAKDPWGGNLNFNPDDNGDGVISMAELYDAIEFNGESDFNTISWRDGYSSSPPEEVHCEPQIADPCEMAEYTYIDEVLKLKNATLSLMPGEDVRYYRVDRVIASNNLVIPTFSKIKFVVDTEVRFKPGFHAQKGCRLNAYIGEIECP